MQKAVLFLLLAARTQANSAPPPSEPHFPTQENFDQHRFMGKWYNVAIASTCPWLKNPKGHLTAGTFELKPGDSSDTVNLTRTAVREGTCKQKSVIYKLSKVAGRLFYHSTKSEVDVNSYVVHTNYDEYAIVAITIKKKGQNRTTILSLYGRSTELRPSLLDDFTQVVKEQGMDEDDVVILKNTGTHLSSVKKAEKKYKLVTFCVLSSLSIGKYSCLSPPESGPCLGWFPRFYYNSTVEACQLFIYGGCKGNQNNFLTEKACLQHCRTEDACRQPIATGPCRGDLPRWAFDSKKQKCVFFTYGGCQGNANNFYSLQECEKHCGVKEDMLRVMPCVLGETCTPPTSMYCHDAPERGPCNATFQRFYYNSSLKTCEEFTYGGCHGNKNNFKTENACLQSCRTEESCKLPIVTGPCRASVPRWAFNSTRGKCVPFLYGGCQGNSNNFYSQSECQEYCGITEEVPCMSPPDEGPCKALFPRYYYDSTLMTCKQFTYGGCLGNQNNFVTKYACHQSCRIVAACRLPAVTGPCKALFRRWAFDSVKGTCVPFIYGGCQGNSNNFYSKMACEELCGQVTVQSMLCIPGETCPSPSSDYCHKPPETGPCDASFQHFYYNSSTMTCKSFTYGGCEGNQNNFKAEDECLQNCQHEAVCRQPINEGPCMASLPRWAFHSVRGECVPFMYGGCHGNSNNFHSKKACEELCGTMEGDPCLSPPDRGPCDGLFPRFYHNSSLMTCENFTYGGCQGNQNNFLTERACLDSCRTPAACRLPIVTGPCKAAFSRWAFSKGTCVPFVYGGCSGNGNNFNSQKKCEEFCGVTEGGDEEVMEVS
ncbi:protein AMBP isoform X1 [Arapaima gigas]